MKEGSESETARVTDAVERLERDGDIREQHDELLRLIGRPTSQANWLSLERSEGTHQEKCRRWIAAGGKTYTHTHIA